MFSRLTVLLSALVRTVGCTTVIVEGGVISERGANKGGGVRKEREVREGKGM